MEVDFEKFARRKAICRTAKILVAAAVLANFAASAATLSWDSNPGSGSADDGSGNWGSTADNTNWWNAVTNVSWNNANLVTAVIGLNTPSAATVTLTNDIVAGGIIFSNTGTATYTLLSSAGSTLSLSNTASRGSIVIARGIGSAGNDIVNVRLLATNGLSISNAGAYTNAFAQFKSATNFITGSLAVGTPGNAAYGAPTAIYADFNTPIDSSAVGINYVLTGTTNVTVSSNATFRISNQNGASWNPPFPKTITISGDGRNGNSGAWIITGNSGGTFNGNVVLAGDSTIDFNSGSAGKTYTLNGVISGTGRLQLVCGNSTVNKHNCVLANPSTYLGKTIIGGGTTVQLISGNNRLPAGTALQLGLSGAANANWNDYGRLVLGNGSSAVSQALSALTTDAPAAANSWVVGGNAAVTSTLTVSNAQDNLFGGTLGGTATPANMLALMKGGAGRLTLAGTNSCAAYTVAGGTLQIGDGTDDEPLSGTITNSAAVVFNVASSLSYGDVISGTGTVTKTGAGSLLFNGSIRGTNAVTISAGVLAGNGFVAGPVTVSAGATLSPGDGVGVLSISNALVLAGTTIMELNPSAPTNDSIRGLTHVTYGGTLVLSNLGGAYAIGNSFKLFNAAAYSGSFANLTPAAPGPGRAWNTNNLLVNGALLVVSNTTPDQPPIWLKDPVVKPGAAASVTYGDTLADSAADPDAGDNLTFSKLSGPAWLTVAIDGTLDGTPGLADVGTNIFAVRVTDSASMSSDATLLIDVANDPNVPTDLASPDGSLVLTFAISNFDGSVSCPVYGLSSTGQTLITMSKLGLTFGSGPLQNNLTVTAKSNASSDTTWPTVYGERNSIRDNYNELTVSLQETVSPNRVLQLKFRAYNQGVAFCYTIPAQAGLSNASSLTEQSEFRFGGNYTAWSVTSAQGNYSSTTISGLANGNERPLTVQAATNLYLSLGEAKLVDYARMKFNQLGKPNSLVSSLSSSVTGSLPLTTPWRFIMVADSPGHLLENNGLLLNLNDPCALTNTAWIKPGKVIREVTLNTTGGMACVDFAVKHKLQYIEFDAGWYGPENTTTDATQVNVDPSRSPGPLDLQTVINYGASNGVGVILYVNQTALTPQIDILPGLYRNWGVKGMKFGFVTVGSQAATTWLHSAFRKAATNQIMVDAHDEIRPSGYTRTYPNLMTLEGIAGDETTPTAAQDLRALFTRMLAGPADHTVCFYDSRVTNNWNHAYQLAKAVCFYSPWQFIYWYDRPTNSPVFSGTPSIITEDPALEFYDYLPTVWDETKVIQGNIGNYAIVARRSGEDWYIGAMNAGITRTLDLPLSFLTPGKDYIAHRFVYDATLPTRTHVRIDRTKVGAGTLLQMTLGASDGQAIRITPAERMVFKSISLQPDGSISMTATGKLSQPYTLWANSNLSPPLSNWSLLTTGLVTTSPFMFVDPATNAVPRRFYLLSTP